MACAKVCGRQGAKARQSTRVQDRGRADRAEMDEHRPDTTVSDPGTPTAEASSTLRTWLASSLDGSWPKTLESFRAIRAGPAREATIAIMGYDPFRQLLQLQDR